jgi:hypothetical protein
MLLEQMLLEANIAGSNVARSNAACKNVAITTAYRVTVSCANFIRISISRRNVA